MYQWKVRENNFSWCVFVNLTLDAIWCGGGEWVKKEMGFEYLDPLNDSFDTAAKYHGEGAKEWNEKELEWRSYTTFKELSLVPNSQFSVNSKLFTKYIIQGKQIFMNVGCANLISKFVKPVENDDWAFQRIWELCSVWHFWLVTNAKLFAMKNGSLSETIYIYSTPRMDAAILVKFFKWPLVS